jgi:hypothetical protein
VWYSGLVVKVAAQGKFYKSGGGCSALTKHESTSPPRMSLHARESGAKWCVRRQANCRAFPAKLIAAATRDTQRREWTHWRFTGGPWKKKRPKVPVSRVFAGGRCGVHPRAIFINYFPEENFSFRQSPWAEKSGQAIDTPLWILHMSFQPRAE